MFKVNNKDTRTTSLDVVLVSLLLTLHTFITVMLCISVNLEQVTARWANYKNVPFELIYLGLFDMLSCMLHNLVL